MDINNKCCDLEEKTPTTVIETMKINSKIIEECKMQSDYLFRNITADNGVLEEKQKVEPNCMFSEVMRQHEQLKLLLKIINGTAQILGGGR